ncbi:MAG: hypothetical protein L3J21_11210 [Devosiaceae bacterium]|nr:hypothetical protein [Devosiaceae bacterium]
MRMNKKLLIGAAAIGFGVFSTGAVQAMENGNDLVHSRELGGQVFMMNEQHMSLYFFDKDEANVSNCYDECAVNWPPALLDAGAELGENYTLFERNDGSMQIAFKGQPLYRFIGDANIGDINGDGKNGVWRLAKP